jgi:hypothetical protein
VETSSISRGDAIVANAHKLFAILHFICWIAVAAVWAVLWLRNGPEPSGPPYNEAKAFLDHLNPLVRYDALEWSVRIGLAVVNWLSIDLGPVFTVSFAVVILLAGTTQWFLLGRLVQWVARRFGTPWALRLAACFTLWFAGSLFLWLAR